MRTREDVSGVPLQGAYVARRCPVRAQNDHDPSLVGMDLGPSEATRARMGAGNAFEASVFEALVAALGDDLVVAAASDPVELRRVTLEAMRSGARLIAGGWLPEDTAGHRTGRPDILVRVTEGIECQYVPVDVKDHRFSVEEHGQQAMTSRFDRPEPQHAEWLMDRGAHRDHLIRDGLQLAHYWRILEQHGFTPAGPMALGGIVDRDRQIWWIDLRAKRWQVWWSTERVSLLDRYDHEFAFRLDIIAHTLARLDDPTLPRKVDPVRIGECPVCPWRSVCLPELEAIDHVSLLPRSNWSRFVEHRRRGVLTRHDLAGRDWRTAAAIFGPTRGMARIDLASIVEAATDHSAGDELGTVIGRRRGAVLGRLADFGLVTVGDLASLDAGTLVYSDAHVGWLPGLIDAARAATSAEPYRARGISELEVPRGDIEIDVDMESTSEGLVYLWGMLVTVQAGEPLGVEGYHPVVTWAPLDATGEADLFREFWTILGGLREAADRSGRRLRVYCYSDAERTQIRRITASLASAGLPNPTEVERLLDSDDWIDLHRTFSTQIVTGLPAGLKDTARLAGFSWRDPDPGGDTSMVWYENATRADPNDAHANQTRLLDYNEDDARATRHLRAWLDGDAKALPPIEAWPEYPNFASQTRR